MIRFRGHPGPDAGFGSHRGSPAPAPQSSSTPPSRDGAAPGCGHGPGVPVGCAGQEAFSVVSSMTKPVWSAEEFSTPVNVSVTLFPA